MSSLSKRRSFPTIGAFLFVVFGMAPAPAGAAEELFDVTSSAVPDEKAVFATIESRRVVPGRSRIGGTVAAIAVKEGDHVDLGQVIATVGDDKLALQMKSLDAQIAGLEAQLAQAQTDLARADELFQKAIAPKTRLDEARTAVNVASNAMRARTAERSVIQQQLTEGNILAPAAGRVLKVPLTAGTVVMSGDPVALIAEQNFVMRLRVPERHARLMKAGDPVRIDGDDLGTSATRYGKISLVYPQIEDGRVVADAAVEGLGDYFVNERIRVWISAGERTAFVIPARFITTRFGVDYVRIRGAGNVDTDVPVQRGRPAPNKEIPDGIEILSGLHVSDRLVRP
ncbi:efflux RND transporter periplasmic adaptor subunit [Bradyrhizobium sp.]|uniref:efflux RND transporter periplasmic adaptor subunit n=1 Tax=Bradyrhizobium sp. TaxID=376 RepID=UPI003FA5C4D2